MTRLAAIRHHGPIQARGVCHAEATTVTTKHVTEIFARCAPIASGTSKNGCRIQSRVIYESLGQLLDESGADLGSVLIEKAFFRNLAADFDVFEQARLEAYRKRGITGQSLPAITCLEQPPCCNGQDVELQAFSLVPNRNGRAEVRSLPTMDLHALLSPEIAQTEIMHTPTLNEADEYGAAFSRGMKMALPEQTYLFISGTAG